MTSNSDAERRAERGYRRYLVADALKGSLGQLAGLAAVCAATLGVVRLIAVVAGPFGSAVYWSVGGGVGGLLALLALAALIRPGGTGTWSKGVANERVARELQRAGEHELAERYFQRALAAFETNPETDIERARISEVRAALNALELRTSDVLTALPGHFREALAAGDYPRAAAVLADWGTALDAGWEELELPVTRLLDAARRAHGTELSASLAELGEQADGHERPDLALELLRAALAAGPARNEGAVLVHAEIAALELRGGNLVEAGEQAVRALDVHNSIGRPWEVEPPYEIAAMGDFPKARELVEARLGRRLPWSPIAYLLCTLSAIYRTIGAPRLAWPCAASALESAWTFQGEFPRSPELVDWAVRELAAIGREAGAGQTPDLREAGLALVESRLGAATAAEMEEATAGVRAGDTLAASADLGLERLRDRMQEGMRAHSAGVQADAREALAEYVEGVHVLEEALAAAGLRAPVDATGVSKSFALLVDSWSTDSPWKALEWSERDKLWAARGSDWRPVETPVLTTWPYPFATV